MDKSMREDEPKNGELTEAQLERLLTGARRLRELDEKVIAAQRELAEAARTFQSEDVTAEPAAVVGEDVVNTGSVLGVLRDNRGEFAAMDGTGQWLYGNPGAENYETPYTLWLVIDGQVVRKEFVDESCNRWVIE
jgi:hypothetical protein